jgi:hypothetical protein
MKELANLKYYIKMERHAVNYLEDICMVIKLQRPWAYYTHKLHWKHKKLMQYYIWETRKVMRNLKNEYFMPH